VSPRLAALAFSVLLLVPLGGLGVIVIRSPSARVWLKYAADRVTVPCPEPLPARDVPLAYPAGLAGASDGTLYISERLGHRIWRLKDGQLTRVAGTGRLGRSPEGVPASRARIYFPEGLAIHPDGGIVFADSWNHRVRRVDAEGRVWTIAGNGNEGRGGDGGPALAAELSRPFDVVIAGDGAVLIVDWGNNCIRRVDAAGTIDTFAGRCGFYGFAGDGGPAVDALLDEPYGIAVGAQGDVYIADSRNDRVRRVSGDGRIETIAGNGITGFDGDGGPATSAQLSSPQAVQVLPDGGLLIDDEHNNRIRRLTPDGRIEGVAGHAARGFGGDGGPARLALLDDPEDIWPDSRGGFYLSDGANGVLRYVDANAVISTVAGVAPDETP
jgi:hypothetical protein